MSRTLYARVIAQYDPFGHMGRIGKKVKQCPVIRCPGRLLCHSPFAVKAVVDLGDVVTLNRHRGIVQYSEKILLHVPL